MQTIDPGSLSPIQLAELSVLAGIIADNDLIDECLLLESDFYDPMYGRTFQIMQELRSEQKPIDPVSLGLMWPQHSAFFWEIGDAGDARHYSAHYAFVTEWATRRKIMAVADGIKQRATDPTYEVGHLIEESRKQIAATQGMGGLAEVYSADVVADVVANVGKGQGLAYLSPWVQLDSIMRGFRPGALYIIGARPGVGKSAIALQMATNAEKFGFVGFFTLEMAKEEVGLRIVSQGATVATTMLESGRPLPGYAAEKVREWQDQYPGRMLMDDRGTITMAQVRAQVRQWSQVGPLSAIVVDYLQLISGPAHMPKLQLVTEISRELKLIARDFNVPVIALSQLNRNSESRVDKKPAMSDLRESGAIEQDADVIILLHRPDEDNREDLQMIIVKNRQGALGSIDLQWQGEFVRAAV